MGVARVKAVGDGSARLVEHDVLASDRPRTAERPVVDAQVLGDLERAALAAGRREVLAARIPEIRLGRAQMVPVRLGLDATPFDGYRFAIDAEQALDRALRLLVAPLAEVVVADDAVAVDEVERGPVLVAEGAPDPVVAVDGHRIVDRSFLRRLLDPVDLVLERELRRVDSDHDQPVVPIGLRPGPDVRLLAQPVDARQRPEVHEYDVPARPVGLQRIGIEPPGRPAEGGNAAVPEDGHGPILAPGSRRRDHGSHTWPG